MGSRIGVWVFVGFLGAGREVLAQDVWPLQAPAPDPLVSAARVGTSPFDPPEANDTVFVVDEGTGLDTGCTYRSGGPLVFTIEVTRVIGDRDQLLAKQIVPEKLRLEMPAFDVDFDAQLQDGEPERDRVSFNGHVVPTDWLQGENNIWRLNAFEVKTEWVNFATPVVGGPPEPGLNTIRIDIDTLNVGEFWCTSIDWAALTVEAPRPVVLAHGIRSDHTTWSPIWPDGLHDYGIPFVNSLDLGALDSIQDNASEIGDQVARYKESFGVDRVVIVAHSKGGIDSRHYVEGHDDVEQLVQLGTPNAGSPLADAIQSGILRLTGLGGSVIVNAIVSALAGPAGVQLTTPYMALYNTFHGHNAKVRYTALAGDYDPDCPLLNVFCRPLDRALLLITGRGDTIVPIDSVHALSYTQNRTYPSQGDIEDAKHTHLTSSRGVFDAVADRIRAPGMALRAAAAPTQVPRTATIAGRVELGEISSAVLPIDTSTTTYILLFYAAGQLDLTLVSPSAAVVDPSVAASDPNIAFEEDDFFGGRVALYAFEGIEPGPWMVHVRGTTVVDPSGAQPFIVQAWLENSDIAFVGVLDDPYRRLGEPLPLAALITRAGAPIASATVETTVGLPDGTVTTVTLTDDGVSPDSNAGDGRYSGVFADTTQAGIYRLRFAAQDTTFSREDFAIATVSASTSTLTGSFRDSGVDLDNDGFFDRLDVGVDLEIDVARTYRLQGRLRDAQGNVHEAHVLADLPIGPATLTLAFDGEALFRNGVNGPYILEAVLLAEDSGIELLPVRQEFDAYATAGYSYLAFEHTPLFLTGRGTSEGVDTNANARFDFLDVAIEVQVEHAAFYQWSARLVDGNGTELGFEAGSGDFVAGVNNMTFRFPGEPIGTNGVDGPYFVRDLLLFGGGLSLVAPEAFVIEGFVAAQFEGVPPTTTTLTTTSSTSTSTTSTTLPGCPVESSFDSIDCRLGDLRQIVEQRVTDLPLRTSLVRCLRRALRNLERGQEAANAGDMHRARHYLRRPASDFRPFLYRLTSPTLGAEVRALLEDIAKAIHADLLNLRDGL